MSSSDPPTSNSRGDSAEPSRGEPGFFYPHQAGSTPELGPSITLDAGATEEAEPAQEKSITVPSEATALPGEATDLDKDQPSALTPGQEWARMASALDDLREEVRSGFAEGDRRSDIIDHLRSDIRALRNREDERRLEPVIRGLISIFDDAAIVAREVRPRERDLTGGELALARALFGMEKQVLELLNRSGAVDFTPEVGAALDGKRQQVAAAVSTENQEKHLTIESVLRPGFEFVGHCLRPASVRVFKYSVQNPIDPERT
jgi:molecular chaperone GrpE (heat shock protein)